jgi:uncharacterized protein DUF4389
MSQYSYEASYTEVRNRLTVAFRILLAIPHLIVSQVWGYLAQILGVVQWFIAVFTGQRNDGIWNMQRQWLDYNSRVTGYVGLLYDPYPAFGTDPGSVPVVTGIEMEAAANRLTVGLRFLWMIPAVILGMIIGIGAFFVAIVSWFAIVITGTHPRGMWDFLHRAMKYTQQVQAYTLLMTDTYPKW